MAVLVERGMQEHVRVVVGVKEVLADSTARELEHARAADKADGDALGAVVERGERFLGGRR